MNLLQGATSLLRSVLTFWLPGFFTFRYLMLNDSPKVKAILKFWVILVIYYFAYYILELIIKGYLAKVIDIGVLILLNYDNFSYSEKFYDSFVSPFYQGHRETIQRYSDQIQKSFEKNSQQLKNKVASSAGDKIKNFLGDVLVGVLNPKQKRMEESSVRSSRESKDAEEEDEEQYENQHEREE